MRRRLTKPLAILALTAVGIGGVLFAVDRAFDRSGPIYRFPAPANESFLTEERAVAIAREVMKRDGLPETDWKLMEDDRSKAPDGRPDRYLMRNAENPNNGVIYFHCSSSRTPQRFVHVNMRDGEIVAEGNFGK